MSYRVNIENGYVIGVGTSQIGTGNITEAEYNLLMQMIHDMPKGKAIYDNNGEYTYVDAPEEDDEPYEEEPTDEDEISDEDAMRILMGEDL